MLLLDTHVALWAMHAPQLLSSQARSTISSHATVYFSSITIVETTIKRLLGRLDVPANLHDVFRANGLKGLALTDVHAAALERLPELAKHDPFDRLLIAQALVENYQFLTADRKILKLGFEWILDARA